MYWGNDAWPVNNRGRRRALRRARACHPAPSFPAAQVGARLDRLGYALLDPGYPAGLVDAIRAGYDKVIDEAADTADMGPIIPEAVRYVIDPVSKVPLLRQLITPQLTEILNAFYGGCWRIEHVRMWRIGHLTEEQRRVHHYGNLWHCDQHPTTCLKLFVQITEDVTEQTGAFRLLDIPDTRRIMRSGYLGTGRSTGFAARMLQDARKAVCFTAPAGHVALCNTTRCLHRAGIPPEGTTRGMVQFTFRESTQLHGIDPFAGIGPDPGVGRGKHA
ncbi:hypothetical protein KDL01_38470 [Actinospica durhamensis]|uniref:Uncharacterized protein n=1 Tax=Actinospica durhamensis TaxID=1508375 RepID=A0A941EY55_9ACTN|nr:hypothetical protein [Actinospica durhamensis]MBR7839211.1 hypothetical protein [Actinospica durhamensis]